MIKIKFVRKSDCIHYYNCLTERSISSKLMECEKSNICHRYVKKELNIKDYEVNNDSFTPAVAHYFIED
jgi:hypothetical protein